MKCRGHACGWLSSIFPGLACQAIRRDGFVINISRKLENKRSEIMHIVSLVLRSEAYLNVNRAVRYAHWTTEDKRCDTINVIGHPEASF